MTGLVESGESYNELRGVELSAPARSSTTTRRCSRSARPWPSATTARRALSDAALPFIEAQAHKRLGVVFRVERTVTWDHTKLGGGY